MTSLRRLAGLGLLGAALVVLSRSSPAPEVPALASVAPSLRDGASADGAEPGDSRQPVYSSAILRWRSHAQERILGRDQGTEDALGHVIPARRVALDEGQVPAPVNGNGLGHFVPVENEAALSQFHAALDALVAHPDQKNKVRIAAYGASHTQADVYASYLRYYLQERFGNGGPGFFPLGMERGWSKHDFAIKNRGVEVEYVTSKGPPPHGRFGMAGSAAVTGPNGWIRITPHEGNDPELAASQYGLYYAAEPSGGDLSISIGGGEAQVLSARSETVEARFQHFERPLGWHTVEVRGTGSGSTRIFGLSIERMQPGVVLDTLGIRGTRAATMLFWDRALWEAPLRQRTPDLLLLAYGTNETTDRNQPIEEYQASLQRVLEKVRQALPDASCVLVGPGDFPKAQGNGWVTRPRLLEIIAEQRRLAPRFGCGFWDAYAFMGGAGSMVEWVRAHPRLGALDHIHLTTRGYVRMGMALGDALLRAYDARHVPAYARVPVQREPEPLRSGVESAVPASVVRDSAAADAAGERGVRAAAGAGSDSL
jgi:lysophospholipase L1-like esterase